MPNELPTAAERAQSYDAGRQRRRIAAQRDRAAALLPSPPPLLEGEGEGEVSSADQPEAQRQEPDATLGRGTRGQTAFAMARQQAGALSARTLAKEAKRQMKRYKIRMQFLEKDIAAELEGIKSTFFYPIGLVAFATSDIVDIVDLGSFWTIVNWILYPIVLFITVQRAYRYLAIRYANPKRQIQRAQKLVARGVFRAIGRALGAVVELVPFLSIIPIWSIVHNVDEAMTTLHKWRLRKLDMRRQATARRMLRLGIRARTPQAQYELAFIGNSMVDDLEKRFDAV